MKKSYLKLLAAPLLLLGSFSIVSCSDKDDEGVETVVPSTELPQAAQTFLNDYFNGYSIIKVVKDVTGGTTIYEVDLQDGYEVDFNSAGLWVEVDAPDGKTIPNGIVPEVIQEYLNVNYSSYGVNEINRTGQGYNVGLVNMQGGDSIDIQFSESGTVIGMGDMN